ILRSYAPSLSAHAEARLRKLGVEVRTNQLVSGVDAAGVSTQEGRTPTRTVIWAAGVAAAKLLETLKVPLDRAGRVHLAPDLWIPGHPEAFAVGDVVTLEQDGRLIPGIAPAAMQEGRHVARAITRRLAGGEPAPFHYHDKGALATIGRGDAIA